MPVFDTRLAAQLGEDRPLLGLFIGLPSPALVEMAGHVGFDFVVIDNEHGPAGIETTEHLVRAAAGAGVSPIVRVSGANRQEILRTLDTGAAGIQVPQINNVEDARLVADAAKYPPEGSRGVAFSTRAAGFGIFGGAAHLAASNKETVVITHIETVEAVRQLDALLEVPAINVWFIGPTDLSVSMGFPGQPAHPEVRATIEQCIAKIRMAGRVAGLMVSNADEFHAFAALGARYITFNVAAVIGGAMRAVVAGTKAADH